jgi:hypothetical protein
MEHVVSRELRRQQRRHNKRRRPVRVKDMLEWVPVPHEDGAEFHMRPLSGGELDQCDEEGTRRVGKQLAAMTGADPELLKELMSSDVEETRQQRRSDSTFGLDLSAVVRYGLQEWQGGSYEGVECSPEEKATLDARTRDWAARWIAERSRRPAGEGPDSEPKSADTDESPESILPPIISEGLESPSPTPITGASGHES